MTLCITFDQPLCVKAMDIIKNKSMNIVYRSGGFQTLMSFMGGIAIMMKDHVFKLVSNFLPQKRKENELAENVEIGDNYEEENGDEE